MRNARRWISSIGQAAAVTTLVCMLSNAHAVPFTPSVVVTGSSDFDQVYSFGASGNFSLTSGGSTTTTNYDAAGVTSGADPLTGALTDTGDGIAISGNAGPVSDFFGVGIDSLVTVTNNASGNISVVFGLDFSNMVDATGTDAFVESELTLAKRVTGEAVFSEVFASHLVTDTLNGNEFNGVPVAGLGGPLSDSGNLLFSYLLAPSEILELEFVWTLNDASGDYAGDGSVSADLAASLTVDAVVPLPGSLLFMVSGMLLLPLQRLLRKK